MCMFCGSLFVLLAILLSVLLRFGDSNCPSGIFKLFCNYLYLHVNCSSYFVFVSTYTFNCQECIGKKNILVTQYPRQETVVDFWTMVYDTDSTVVVVLELRNEVCTDQCWSFISNPSIVFRKHVKKIK
jgi:hypothetical protein